MAVAKTSKGYATRNKSGEKKYFSTRGEAISFSKQGASAVGTVIGTNARGGVDKLSNKEMRAGITVPSPTDSTSGMGNTTGITATPKDDTATEPGVISSKQGVEDFNQFENDAKKMAAGLGTPESPLNDAQILELERQGYMEGDVVPGKGRLTPGGYYDQSVSTGDASGAGANEPTTTYVDQNGATITTTGKASGSDEERKKMEERGYTMSESTQPSEEATDPETKRMQDELTQAENEVNIYKKRLTDLIITDAELRSDIRGITSAYDARIAEMQDITNRQIQATKTLGFRMGMQFTGGVGGVWGGIISEAERNGLMKIAELEGEKQSKIIEAKAEARKGNYTIYAALMSDARDIASEKSKALAELRKEQREQDKKIAERKAQVTRDTAIANLYTQGITDPQTLVDFMNYDEQGNLIGDTTLEDVEKALKILNPPDALKGLDADYQTFAYLKKMNDPSVKGLDWMDYQRVMANLKASASGANKTTAEERKMSLVSEYASRLVPGVELIPDSGEYIIGEDGRISPLAWNTAVNDAQQRGLDRETFIKEFGYLINPKQILNPDWEQYNLSAEEYKRATGVEVKGESSVSK